MKHFDVLDPNLSLKESRFIEASAGTGKTFAIENLVLRLLSEEDGPSIEEILVVTFTRKATCELKNRILARIEKGLFECRSAETKKRLKKALFLFDEAQIFTIHGFCFHALKEYAFDSDFFYDEKEEASSSLEASFSIIKDFLRAELQADLIHPKQLEKLLNFFKKNPERLIHKLAELAGQRLPIHGGRPFCEIREEINEVIADLKTSHALSKEALEKDLLVLASYYNGFLNRQRTIKVDALAGIQKFVSLFDSLHDDFLDLPVLKMTPENRLKKELDSAKLNEPRLLDILNAKLFPLLHEASNPLLILGLLAEECRCFLEKAIQRKELIFFEDLLKKMEMAIENPIFLEKMQKSYRAVLIDEFQDTDPLQWRIFSKLFKNFSSNGPLFLVGDPKQSIYNFRGADVYTYLEARESMGQKCLATLLHNYRSDPPLVEALNALFASPFLFLPKLNTTLECPPVYAAAPFLPPFHDGKKSVHLCVAETEEALFTYIVNEILHLHEKEKVPLEDIAILVKDRYQAERFAKGCPFPISLKEHQMLGDTAGFAILLDLLKAILNPLDRSLLIKALMGPFFNLQEDEVEEKTADFYRYHAILEEKGIFSLFQSLLEDSHFADEKIYLQMLQIVELIAKHTATKDGILPFFQKLKEETGDGEEFKVRTLVEKNGVSVMTVHVSKGLEFPIVFPIGLALSVSSKKDFSRDGEKLVIKEKNEEAEAEKMRQLYVAFTRAKKRLYIPIIKKEKNSPISLFLKTEDFSSLASRIPNATFSFCAAEEKKEYKKPDPILYPPKELVVNSSPLFIFSYSSLARKERAACSASNGLPQGPETGRLLHSIFEEIPFTISETALAVFLDSFLDNTHLQLWKKEVKDLILNVLEMKLASLESCFSLRDLDPSKQYKELEFLYPEQEPAGFCKGFIDLFFEHQEKIYFLDWKSNDLGEDYSFARMQKAMQEHQYDLQAKIYAKAAKKYLKLFDKEKHFAGCFYVFLRGPSYIYLPN